MKGRSGCSGWIRLWAMITAFCGVWIGAGATTKGTRKEQGAWVSAGGAAKGNQRGRKIRRQVTLKEYVQLARAKLGRKQESSKTSGPPEEGSAMGKRGAADSEDPENNNGREPERKQADNPKYRVRKHRGKKVDDGAGTKGGAGQEAADPDRIRTATINITTMATSQVTLFEREEDLIFFQEHTTPGNNVATIQALAAERGWRMDLGPVDESTDRISAGVGAMWNPGRVKIHIAALSTREGRYFEKIGRLRKYIVQFVQ